MPYFSGTKKSDRKIQLPVSRGTGRILECTLMMGDAAKSCFWALFQICKICRHICFVLEINLDPKSQKVKMISIKNVTGAFLMRNPWSKVIFSWKTKMSTDKVFVDNLFIPLSAEVLNRIVVLYPVFVEDGHTDGKIIISPKSPIVELEPWYILYYSETSFICGHYQSIRPKNGLENILVTSISSTNSFIFLGWEKAKNF